MFSKLDVTSPFSSKVKYKPDVESTTHTKLKRGRVGLAKVRLTKYLFPKSGLLRASDLIKSDVETPKLKHGYVSIRAVYARGSYHGLRGSTAYGSVGSYVTYVYSEKYSSRIAILPTLLRVLSTGRKSHIGKEDIAYKLLAGKRRLLLLVAFDCSDSMKPYTIVLLRTLMMFHKIAWKMRSLVGMIAIKSPKSEVVIYPTTNINKLIRGVHNLTFGGKTPLAEGLLRAYRLIMSMRTKFPDALLRILLFTDGIANIELKEPISNYFRKLLVSPAQADVLYIGKKLGAKEIRTIIVNPWHMDKWPGKVLISPTELLVYLAKLTGGIYLGFNLERLLTTSSFTRFSWRIDEKMIDELARNILESIFESIFQIY